MNLLAFSSSTEFGDSLYSALDPPTSRCCVRQGTEDKQNTLSAVLTIWKTAANNAHNERTRNWDVCGLYVKVSVQKHLGRHTALYCGCCHLWIPKCTPLDRNHWTPNLQKHNTLPHAHHKLKILLPQFAMKKKNIWKKNPQNHMGISSLPSSLTMENNNVVIIIRM